MSASVSTASQPMLSTDHIFGHPGSTFAGVGLWASSVLQMLSAGGVPTGTAGWVSFGVQAGMGLLAILGK